MLQWTYQQQNGVNKMTQTVRIHNKLNKQVDIYSHPNNYQASINDKDSRYCYTVNLVNHRADDIINNLLSDGVEIDSCLREEVQAIVNNVNQHGYIYRIEADLGIDETGLHFDDLYHSSYQKALDECMTSLYC